MTLIQSLIELELGYDRQTGKPGSAKALNAETRGGTLPKIQKLTKALAAAKSQRDDTPQPMNELQRYENLVGNNPRAAGQYYADHREAILDQQSARVADRSIAREEAADAPNVPHLVEYHRLLAVSPRRAGQYWAEHRCEILKQEADSNASR